YVMSLRWTVTPRQWPAATDRQAQLAVPPSGLVTQSLYVAGVTDDLIVTVVVSLPELTTFVLAKEMPLALLTLAPATKLLPVTVSVTFCPCVTELGRLDEGAGAGSIVRHPEQRCEIGPGSMTAMSRRPVAAVVVAATLTWMEVRDSTFTELADTRVPETKTDGLALKPF